MPESNQSGRACAPSDEPRDGAPPVTKTLPAVNSAAIVRAAMEEVLGREATEAIVVATSSTRGDSPSRLTAQHRGAQIQSTTDAGGLPAIMECLEAMYGTWSGRGIAWRVGQACFQHGLREYGGMSGAEGPGFRLSPLSGKIRASLQWLARLLNDHAGHHILLEDQGGGLVWRVQRCPLCDHRVTPEPACYLTVGLLQEALAWLSGGRVFRVEETECLGRGDAACSFLIDETPVNQTPGI